MGDQKCAAIPFEDALDKAGNGLYNFLLVVTCSWTLVAVAMDLVSFNLVVAAACDLNLTVTQKGILTSLPFISNIFVSFLWGYIADTYGRRFTLIISLTIGSLLSILSSLSPNWIILSVVRFVSVCFSCAAHSFTFTLVGESSVLAQRSKYALIMTSFFFAGPAFGAAIAYPFLKMNFALEVPWLGVMFKPWRLLILAYGLSVAVGALALCAFYESPRFLASRGRKKEALKVLKSINKFNCRGKEEYEVFDLKLEESQKEHDSLLRSIYEQSATLFRPPYIKTTLKLYYIVMIVYSTCNGFLMWLPHIMDKIMTNENSSGNICTYLEETIQNNTQILANETLTAIPEMEFNIEIPVSDNWVLADPVARCSAEDNWVRRDPIPVDCVGTVQDTAILSVIASQTSFALLNLVVSYFTAHRRELIILILSVSGLSGIFLNFMPETISSLITFIMFACTTLAIGILYSFFMDFYPTSYRGIATCLSVMVARASAFFAINLIGNVIFLECQITFYCWSAFIFSGVLVAWCLPVEMKKEVLNEK